MRILYVGHDANWKKKLVDGDHDFIALHRDKWDDFNYKTTFKTSCEINGTRVALGSIQILIDGAITSYEHLDNLIAKGWDGVFPVPGFSYISTPESLSFYEQIEGQLGINKTIQAARALRDASYLTKLEDDSEALRLVGTEGFRVSLQRERGAIKAYLDGWKFFGKQSVLIGDQQFHFTNVTGDMRTLQLKFAATSPLPHDINILVGPNGVGKSQLLHQMVASWLELKHDEEAELGFANRPNLSQIVVVSYSPFELFKVDTSDDSDRRDHNVYKYFGLRGRKRALNDSQRGSSSIMLSRQFPKTNAANSLLSCAADDQKYGGITEWSNKVETMELVLRQAFSFDYAAVVMDRGLDLTGFLALSEPPRALQDEVDEDQADILPLQYLPITPENIGAMQIATIRKHLHAREGVIFVKGGKQVHLSSGQRLFSYIVINILGAIRRNSLIIIDEPELFLHSSLEIAFIRMLKTILASYASKALIATHSLVTVREVPRDCVHVFERTKNGIEIKTPPFETFGGDIQRISSYVFGDKRLSKPYEEWVRKQLREYGSATKLLDALGDDVNEELLIQISAMGHQVW